MMLRPPCRRADPANQVPRHDLLAGGRGDGLPRWDYWWSHPHEVERECQGAATPLQYRGRLGLAYAALHGFVNELPVFWALRTLPPELNLGE